MPFSVGYRAASHVYRHQSQELGASDLQALLGTPAGWGGRPSYAAKLAPAFTQTAGRRASAGGRVLSAVSSIWGRRLVKIAILDFFAILWQAVFILWFGLILHELEHGIAVDFWWLERALGSEMSRHASLRVIPLALASAAAWMARHHAAHRRAHVASEVEVALRVWVFSQEAGSMEPRGQQLGEVFALLPGFAADWVRRSTFSAAAHFLGAGLAAFALWLLLGFVGLGAVVLPVLALALEALVSFKIVKHWHAAAMEARGRREAVVGELIERIAMVKHFAWERLYFRQLDTLRSEERQAQRRLARAWAWAAAFNVDLVLLLQGAACSGVGFYLGVLSEVQLWHAFVAWLSCRMCAEELRQVRRALMVPSLLGSAKAVEAMIVSCVPQLEAPAQGNRASYKATKHAVTIEGMRFFWQEGTAAGSAPGAKALPDTVGAAAEATTAARGSQAGCSSIADLVTVANTVAIAPAARPNTDAIAEEGPTMGGAPQPGQVTGLDLVDLVTDDGSVAARAARAARGAATQFDLKVLSFQVKRGSLVALVGAAGCGKSTLLAALCGTCRQALWGDDAEGTGVHLSGRLAFAPQQPIVMSKCSIRDNVICGLPFDQAQYDQALMLSTLWEDVALLPRGDMQDASDLPHVGGARACLQLARALYLESEILLVDDPFVSMENSRAERLLTQGLKKLAKERTILLATQNLSILSGMQQIVVIRNGTVFETGDYKTLSSMPTEFSRLMLIANQKEAKRALELKRLSTHGVPCPFLSYEVDADPMDEIFPLDREFEAGGFVVAPDDKWTSLNTGGTDLWLSQRGQSALVASQAAGSARDVWDTTWSAGMNAGGVSVRDGRYTTVDSSATPRPGDSARLRTANRGAPKNQRESLGGHTDRRGGFAYEAPDAEDITNYFDSGKVSGLDSSRRKERKSLGTSDDIKPDVIGKESDLQLGGGTLPDKSKKKKKGTEEEPLTGAGGGGEKPAADTAPSGMTDPAKLSTLLLVRSGGLPSLLLLPILLLSMGMHVGTQYLFVHLVSTSGSIGSEDIAGATAPDTSNPNSSVTTSTINRVDLWEGIVKDGYVWRGFGDPPTTTIELLTTLPQTTHTTTTTTTLEIDEMIWVLNETGKFCSDSDFSSEDAPGDGFECDRYGCYRNVSLSLGECEDVCELLAGPWGCRYISWGGPATPRRWCYVLKECDIVKMIPRYTTLKLNVTFLAPDSAPRLLQSFTAEGVEDELNLSFLSSYWPRIFIGLCVALALLSVGQATLAVHVALNAAQEAATKQLRAVLAAALCVLGDSEPQPWLRSRLIEDVADMDSHLLAHLPRFYLTLTHVLAAAAALVVLGTRNVVLVIAISVILCLSAYLHLLRLPLLTQLRRLRTEAEAGAALRTTQLAECHLLLRIHGNTSSICEDFEVRCKDAAQSLVAQDLTDRWLYTRVHLLCVALQGLLAFAVVSEAEVLVPRYGITPFAVALLQIAMLPEPLVATLRHGAALHHGLYALQRMQASWNSLLTEELDSPALRLRPTSVREINEAVAGQKARNRIVIGDSVIQRGSEEERVAALYDLAALECEQGISVAGFELEDVADDWPYFGAVDFQEVTFRYASGSAPAVNRALLEVHVSKSVLLVGPRGSGKSSLLGLLLRHRPVESGGIILDCVDVRSVGLMTLRSRIAFVPQQVTIFKGTWRHNLDPMGEFSDEQLSQATRLVRLSNWLSLNAPKGLEELLPEGDALGAHLKALIGLCRGILRLLQKRSKLLVLDCTTCRLDAFSDANLTALVLRFCRRREAAVLQATQRVNQAALYDSAVVLEAGRVLEQGPAKKLWAKDGAFRSLARAQGVDSSAMTKPDAVADRLTSVWSWDVSPQEDALWSDDFSVKLKKAKDSR